MYVGKEIKKAHYHYNVNFSFKVYYSNMLLTAIFSSIWRWCVTCLSQILWHIQLISRQICSTAHDLSFIINLNGEVW